MPTPSKAYIEAAQRFGGVDAHDPAAVERFFARFGELPQALQDRVLEALLEQEGEADPEPEKREYAPAVPVPSLSGDRDLDSMADLGLPDEPVPGEEGGILVVKSKVRELIKKSRMNTSGDAIEALSKAVEELVKSACRHAAADHRDTVEADDFVPFARD